LGKAEKFHEVGLVRGHALQHSLWCVDTMLQELSQIICESKPLKQLPQFAAAAFA